MGFHFSEDFDPSTLIPSMTDDEANAKRLTIPMACDPVIIEANQVERPLALAKLRTMSDPSGIEIPPGADLFTIRPVIGERRKEVEDLDPEMLPIHRLAHGMVSCGQQPERPVMREYKAFRKRRAESTRVLLRYGLVKISSLELEATDDEPLPDAVINRILEDEDLLPELVGHINWISDLPHLGK